MDGHRTLADRAFSVLHNAIVTGVLEPGERLPIEDLAELLGMSPMPIREALRRLDSEGMVDSVPHRGARVTELSTEDLQEVYEARLALEPIALRRAAERFTDAAGDRSRETLTRHALAIRQHAVAEAWETHTAFHLSLYRAGGSRWLMRLITPLFETSNRYRHASGLVDWHLHERAGEHEEILQSCVDRDPVRAAGALHNHLARTANSVSRAIGGHDLFDPVPTDAPSRRSPSGKPPSSRARRSGASR
ncbi:MAG: GntR family transcriptional regulator [Acidimicrobiales bacterium]